MANILVGCEFSGVVRDAFTEMGHNAFSCDVLPSEASGQHIQEDLISVLKRTQGYWSLAVFHPPCTYLCNSGVRWLKCNPERRAKLKESIQFWKSIEFYSKEIPHTAIENPVMHCYGTQELGKPSFTCQPWMFGDNFKKRTCFWLKELPELEATSSLDGSTASAEVHNMGPSKDRGKKRSIFYKGMARAMAEQWSNYLENY